MLPKLYMGGQVHIKNADSMEFEAYANVKNVVDHALDVAMDGCYEKSIADHKANGTRPKLLWSHNPYDYPIGVITDFEEDSKGLFFRGLLSDTDEGIKTYKLAKMGALDQFSIGYVVQQEKWNSEKGYNELHQIDVKEISWVNFACNEESRLQTIKAKFGQRQMPTVRDLERFLRESGLSKSEAKILASQYRPKSNQKVDVKLVNSLKLFS